MNTKVILGGCFGNEGKGLAVDYFTKGIDNTLIIKPNAGSAYSSHTMFFNKKSTTLSYLNSGSYNHCDTYLDKSSIIDLDKFKLELEKFGNELPSHYVYIHPDTKVVTIFDKTMNEESTNSIEKVLESRSKSMEDIGLSINDLFFLDEKQLVDRLYNIRNKFFIKGTGMTVDYFYTHYDVLNAYSMFNICNNLLTIREKIRKHKIKPLSEIKDYDYNILIENAGGILSGNNLKQNISILNRMGINNIDLTYVLRPYMMKRGDDFPTKGKYLQIKRVFDANDNDNQEVPASIPELSYGPLDLDLIKKAIDQDLKSSLSIFINNVSLMITHIDQMVVDFPYWYKKKEVKRDNVSDFINDIKSILGIEKVYISDGPYAKDVKLFR